MTPPDTHVIELLATLLGSGFVLTFVLWLKRKLVTGWRRAKALVANVTHLLETAQRTETDVAWVVKELKPNGGHSLRDGFNRLERLMVFERTARRMTMTDLPVYERNEQGRVMYVSPAFTQLTGLSMADCRDAGWSRVVAPEERARVLKAFAYADREQTVFAEEFSCVHPTTHQRVRVQLEEVPIFHAELLVGWVGRWSTLTPEPV